MISTMEEMQDVTDKCVNVSSLQQARSMLVNVESDMKSAIDQSIKLQERINNTIRDQPDPKWDSVEPFDKLQSSNRLIRNVESAESSIRESNQAQNRFHQTM
ncbi:hypothetical protein MUN88_19080 [Gracilibacillus caseinilyticus]|uniref:Type VII secretion effector, SACOL2603 family n=1 Tax=Gracilibacillus caseinilyticus TaxID=2932256 RepID=A0ABY4EV17_9BACI|nr:hypothetical protein [Gracilibacillus caseinilyticus]UOQ48124.1 hypothetical protein MUN88_19080 [Gracilibacillus caseinilyticus]